MRCGGPGSNRKLTRRGSTICLSLERPVSSSLERPVSSCLERPMSSSLERPVSSSLERPVSSSFVATACEILVSHSNLYEDSVLSSFGDVSIGKELLVTITNRMQLSIGIYYSTVH